MLAIRTAAIPVKTCTTVLVQMVQRNVAEEDVQAQQYHALHVNKICMGCTLMALERLVLLLANATPVPLPLNNRPRKKYSHIHCETNRAAQECATTINTAISTIKSVKCVAALITHPQAQCGVPANCIACWMLTRRFNERLSERNGPFVAKQYQTQ